MPQSKKDGVYNKFNVQRVDGTPLPETAVFFALRLDFHGDDEETVAARDAVLQYAASIGDINLEQGLLDYFNS